MVFKIHKIPASIDEKAGHRLGVVANACAARYQPIIRFDPIYASPARAAQRQRRRGSGAARRRGRWLRIGRRLRGQRSAMAAQTALRQRNFRGSSYAARWVTISVRRGRISFCHSTTSSMLGCMRCCHAFRVTSARAGRRLFNSVRAVWSKDVNLLNLKSDALMAVKFEEAELDDERSDACMIRQS